MSTCEDAAAEALSTVVRQDWGRLVALLLVAEPLRNTGRYTMADVLSFRMKQRPVRLAGGFC